MTARSSTRPINLSTAGARRVFAGLCSQERRFDSPMFDRAKPGDLLWIREPFRFDGQWDGETSPTRVLRLVPFAAIWFEADGSPPAGFGKCRAGRMLPRERSRGALKVVAVRKAPLQEIDAADRAALGCDEAAYAREWDRNQRTAISITGGAIAPGLWSANPHVTIVDFELLRGNIDALVKKKAAPDRSGAADSRNPPAATGESAPGDGSRHPCEEPTL